MGVPIAPEGQSFLSITWPLAVYDKLGLSSETALQALACCRRVSAKRPGWLAAVAAEERVGSELLGKVKIENQVVYFQKVDGAISPPVEKVLVSAIAFEPQVKRQNLFVD